jgi:hypothetical protein
VLTADENTDKARKKAFGKWLDAAITREALPPTDCGLNDEVVRAIMAVAAQGSSASTALVNKAHDAFDKQLAKDVETQ